MKALPEFRISIRITTDVDLDHKFVICQMINALIFMVIH
jgi:hypothetical protein